MGGLPESSTRGLLVGKLLVGGLGVQVKGISPVFEQAQATAVAYPLPHPAPHPNIIQYNIT